MQYAKIREKNADDSMMNLCRHGRSRHCRASILNRTGLNDTSPRMWSICWCWSLQKMLGRSCSFELLLVLMLRLEKVECAVDVLATASRLFFGDENATRSLTIALCTITVLWLSFLLLRSSGRQKRLPSASGASSVIPTAPGNLPILGHALSYKKNPAAFLRKAVDTCGPIFRLNLAGRRFVAVTDSNDNTTSSSLVRQVGKLTESEASARLAVSEIGFDYTLGRANVFVGTEWHKRVLKDKIWRRMDELTKQLLPALTRNLDYELQRHITQNSSTPGRVLVPDLFDLTRRVVLRTLLQVLVGTCILPTNNSASDTDQLVLEMMKLEDEIEGATAAAAVLPKWLSKPFILYPVQWQREKVQKKIAFAIEKERLNRITRSHLGLTSEDESDRWGPWLAAEGSTQSPGTPGAGNGNRSSPVEMTAAEVSEIAELVVGLMFAAHKNAAIASAQTFCFFAATKDEQSKECQEVQREASILLRDPKQVTMDMIEKWLPHTRNHVLETLRLSAHSIGALRKVCRPVRLRDKNRNVYHIQEGETIAVLHNAMNTSREIWGPDALEFRPSRFTEKGNLGLSIATFSHGVHKCPGERVAMTVVEILFALLVDRNATVDSAMPSICFERATLAQRAGPVAISIDET